jgi:hypothetical protein
MRKRLKLCITILFRFPSAGLDELARNAADIRQFHADEARYVRSLKSEASKPPQRAFGLTVGSFVMHDDFDDELPPDFWLGDE